MTIRNLHISAALLCCALTAGHAAADVYTTLGGYYSKVDKPVDRSGSGGQIGVGYTLTEQWSLELGYDQLIDQSPQWPGFANISNPNNGGGIVFKSGHKSAGLSLSVLGKTALDEYNTLFYRVGAINNKSESWVFQHGSAACTNQIADTFTYDFISNNIPVGTVRACGNSSTNTALLYGLGIDHQFNQHWFSRVELVGLSDPDAESLYALKLAVGYRF
jgi:opacity protein-like surface antigen